MNTKRTRRAKFRDYGIISPLYDFAFSQIFGNQENIDITRAFLKTLLDIPEDDYDKLTVENPILKRFFQKDKSGVVDLKLSTKSGRIIHIELQVNKRANLRSRILYYSARLIGDQLHFGDDYNKLHQVISIVICDHELLWEEKSYINVYELQNNEKRCFTDLLKVVILELPKLPQTEDSAVWPWLRFLTCNREEEFDMLASEYPEVEKAVFCAKKMSFIEKWRNIQFHKNLWKVDERMLFEQARIDGHDQGLTEGRAEGLAKGIAEGRTEGIAEGIAEGKIEGLAESREEIARKLKSRGRPVEEIAEDTGLT